MKPELYEQSYKNPKHFSFGKNWQSFLKNYNDERIKNAENSLINFLGGKKNIAGKTFVDIGCGSGLFSLAAHRLGAKKVISVDIDEFSIACVKYLHKMAGQPANWEIKEGSALDKKFLDSLGTFDIVYSWGVLHHTGDMYQALRNVTQLMNKAGKFYVALYNNNQRILEGTSTFWLKVKRTYNASPWFGKKLIEIIYLVYYLAGLASNRINPISYITGYDSLRGMNFFTDIKDWLGGYPYEYASTTTIKTFFNQLNFNCTKIVKARSIGCNEFLIKRSSDV